MAATFTTATLEMFTLRFLLCYTVSFAANAKNKLVIMSRLQILRALVMERLTAAAEEIFALVERTIAEYEEELCGFREENQRKQQLLDQVLNSRDGKAENVTAYAEPRLSPEIPEAPQVKEESEEHRFVKEDEEQFVQFTSSVCMKREERSQTESQEETHFSGNDWDPPVGASAAQVETEADVDNYNQIKDIHNPVLFSKYRFAPETSAAVTHGHMSVTGAEQRRKHECPFCKKNFVTKHSLLRHTRVHTGEKPYSCVFCNKAYIQKISCEIHMRTHTGERPYKCAICDKCFIDNSTLTIHTRTHTGERPYSCPLCRQTFSTACNLKKHQRKHHLTAQGV